ncbi:hypothetical protein AVEN_263596-1 [Araneus ventricosus]|uniref:Uncharacterized protein n=1 Tax=Araneus ventricosus TaxID=182803 RepID=A0A4Y2HZE2_ARAVE|nr:hypothetical protein AVEN_263596-1 [Araneus ventricosus]
MAVAETVPNVEAGVLMRFTGHSPAPSEVGTHYHLKWASQSHYCTLLESEKPLTCPADSHPCARDVAQRDRTLVRKKFTVL